MEHARGLLFEYLSELAQERQLTFDEAQRRAASRLQFLVDELAAFRAARQSPLKRMLFRPQPPRGVYFWGGVGRGKSLLMDSFFHVVPIRRKTRMHFHPFMRHVHEELKRLKNEPDPLATVASHLAKQYRLICFDEFHVNDIADAMILGRLLRGLFDLGVVFVMTSNYPPDKLYHNGLQRQNFLPTIELLKEKLDVAEVDSGVDYRLRALEHIPTYYTPLGDASEQALDAAFQRMRSADDEPLQLEIEHRIITAKRRAGSLVWFDFATLCESARSQNDYLELARSFNTVFLSGVPKMTAAMSSPARRFTWLVDIFYDHRIKLFISAAVPPEQLYTEGTLANEFTRTVSRLIEMQSAEYMRQPHIVA